MSEEYNEISFDKVSNEMLQQLLEQVMEIKNQDKDIVVEIIIKVPKRD